MAGALAHTVAAQPWSCRPKWRILVKSSPPFPNHSLRIRSTAALFSTYQLRLRRKEEEWRVLIPRASVGSAEIVVEPETGVKFGKELTIPGCSKSMILLGTGYREKVFAIIGVKIYAAGFFASNSLEEVLDLWKGKSTSELSSDPSLFKSIFNAPAEKSLQIVLVRDVDGNTFWNALNDAVAPRIKERTATDESALLALRQTFEGRSLTKGTVVFLTWVEPSKMLVSFASEGASSSAVDATVESINVSSALFDAFLGDAPVSPTLKASVANGLEALLK